MIMLVTAAVFGFIFFPPDHNAKNNRSWVEPETGIVFRSVPKGCFITSYGNDICLEKFWIGQFEVTQDQWIKVMGENRNPSLNKGGNLPVENVSWMDVQLFLKELNTISPNTGFRLPTEAEWEYACLDAGQEMLYCGGDDAGQVAWHIENRISKTNPQTQPVGRREPNALGVYDMSGNVWEWVADEMESGQRLRRGGAVNVGPQLVQASVRDPGDGNNRSAFLGFRIAR